MEHGYEAYRSRAEEVIQDTLCTIGLGAKKLTDAAKRQLEIADLHAAVNTALRELGELLYATHTGNPTDSDVLLEKMQEIDGLKARLLELEGEPVIHLLCPPLRTGSPPRRRFLPGLRRTALSGGALRRITCPAGSYFFKKTG